MTWPRSCRSVGCLPGETRHSGCSRTGRLELTWEHWSAAMGSEAQGCWRSLHHASHHTLLTHLQGIHFAFLAEMKLTAYLQTQRCVIFFTCDLCLPHSVLVPLMSLKCAGVSLSLCNILFGSTFMAS